MDPWVVRDAGGHWTTEFCGGCPYTVVSGDTWVEIPQLADSGGDPDWFQRMFDRKTGVSLFPALRSDTKLYPPGTQLPRASTQNRLRFGQAQEQLRHVHGEGFGATRMRTYQMLIHGAFGQQGTSVLTSAPTWPETLGGGARSLVLPYDQTVAPFVNLRRLLPDEEAMATDGVQNAFRAMVDSFREALDRVLTEHEMHLGGEISFRPWCLRVMDASGAGGMQHNFVLSLWFVVSNLVMANVGSVRSHFVAALMQYLNPELRDAVNTKCYSKMSFPLPWSRDEFGNWVRPVDPDTGRPVCTPQDGAPMMASRLGDYLPAPHLRQRRLLLPIFDHDHGGDEARWAANDALAALEPGLYADDNVVRDPADVPVLMGRVAAWRYRVPAHVMRLARNLVAMGVGTDELERRTPMRAWVEQAKAQRPSTRDLHDGALVRWAKADSERAGTAPPAAADADAEPLEVRVARPQLATPGRLFYDLEGHAERARLMDAQSPLSPIGILQRAEVVDAAVEYVRPFPPTTRGIRFVKAALGTGKSVSNWETVVQWLKAFHLRGHQPGQRCQPLRVLVGTPRRTLAAAVLVSANRYLQLHWDPWERAENLRIGVAAPTVPRRFVHYMDESQRQQRPDAAQQQHHADMVVWQLESFRRLADVAPFDIVLFDEVASLLRCLTGHMVRKARGQLEDTVHEFARLVNAAKLMIVSDGNMTLRDIRAINDACARTNGALRQLVLYQRIPQRGRVVWFFSERPPSDLMRRTERDRKNDAKASCTALSKWVSCICRDVAQNKRVYVYSGSKRILVETLVPELRTIPGFSTEDDLLLMTAQTVNHSDPMDVMAVWPTKRVVAVSPTVTVGLDFSPPHPYFHSVYAYVSTFGAGPRDSVQGMVRVRNTIERTVNVCMRLHVDSRARPGKANRCVCARNADVRTGFVRRVTGARDHVWANEPPWLEELAVDNALEDDVAQSDLLGCVRTLLRHAGYDSDSGEVFRRALLDDDDVHLYVPRPLERTFFAVDNIAVDRYQYLRGRMGSEGVTEEERLAVLRYDFVHGFATDPANDEVNAAIWDWTCAKRKCLNAFRHLQLERGEGHTAVSRIIDRDAAHTNMASFVPQTNIQMHVVMCLYRDVLRIKGSWVDYEFSRGEVAQWGARIRTMQDVAMRQFAFDRTNSFQFSGQESTVEYVVKWIDRVLCAWSGATLCAHDCATGLDVHTETQWKAVTNPEMLVVKHWLVPGVRDVEHHLRIG